MAIRFCIFDVGGVCYPYSLTPLNECLRAQTKDVALFDARHGAKSYNFDSFMSGKTDYKSFCKDLCRYCKVPYNKKMPALINKALHRGVGAYYKETLSLMKYLRRQKIKVCLLSNALPNLKDTAAHLTFPNQIFTSFELGLLKPDPKIYQTVLEKLKAKPSEVIFIDDKLTNVDAAQKLGLHGIVYERKTIQQNVENTLLSEKNFPMQKDLSNSF